MFWKNKILVVCSLFLFVIVTACTPDSKEMLNVVTKSQQEMSKLKGFKANVKSDIEMNMQGRTTTIQSDQDFEKTNNPLRLHAKMTSTISGMSVQGETYYLDNKVYQLMNNKWFQFNVGALNEVIKQSNQSKDSLNNIQSLVKIYQQTDDSDEINMKKLDNGDYQVTININSTKGNQELKKQVESIVHQSLGNNSLAANPIFKGMLQGLKFEYYKTINVIDGKTYLLKSVNSDVKLSMQGQGTSMSMIQKQNYTFKGAYNGTITIPADIQSNAQIIDNSALQTN